MQKNREVIAHQKQYCMINHRILFFPNNDIIKNVRVCLGKYTKIFPRPRQNNKNQSCLKSSLSMKNTYLAIFSSKKQLKCFFSLLVFSYLVYYNNIIYNKYIISNTKIKKINLVIKNSEMCITKCLTNHVTFCKI